jgi:hypothetical protein
MERVASIRKIFRRFCAKYALVIVCTFSIAVHAQTVGQISNNAIPQKSITIQSTVGYEEISPGNILIVSYDDQDQEVDWTLLVGKRITPVLFLLESKGDKLKVLVTDPSKEHKTIKVEDEEYTVFMQGFKFVPSKEKMGDFLFEDFSIKDTFVEKYGLVILVGVIGTTLLMIFGLKWLKQRSVKREMHKNKKSLVAGVVYAKTREDFEKVFSRKSEFEQYQLENDELTKLIKLIDQIQYKEKWTNEELAQIKSTSQLVEKKWIANGV